MTWKSGKNVKIEKIGINPTVTEPTWAGRPLVFAVLRSSFFVLTFVRFGRGLGKLRSSLCFALTAQLRGARLKTCKPVFAGKLPEKTWAPPQLKLGLNLREDFDLDDFTENFLAWALAKLLSILGSKILMSVDDFSLSTHKKKNREMTDQK